MSQVIPVSLPDTLTPTTAQCTFDEVEIWGYLLPKRCFVGRIDLINKTYTLGRKDTCEICISLKNTASSNLISIISKQHFRMFRDSSLVPCIEDLSRNGTYLNGKLIGKYCKITLTTGDVIAVGHPQFPIFSFYDQSNNNTEYDRKYKETKFLGRGAFGEVMLVYSKLTSRRFAVKKIPKIKIMNGQLKSNDEKIQNEIKILEALKHPCVIHLEEIIYTHDQVNIILEYMEGGELQNRIIKKCKLTENVAKLFFYQMSLALQYLHGQGITHRDLKPDNILLATNDEMTIIKVSDFGLSKLIDSNSVLKSLCGTPMYVAPEILMNNGMGTYTPQVDIWSMGVILYYCLCGDLPFSSDVDDKRALFFQILEGKYTVPDEIKDSVSQEAIDMLLKTLTVDSKKRINLEDVFKHKWLMDTEMTATFTNLLMNV